MFLAILLYGVSEQKFYSASAMGYLFRKRYPQYQVRFPLNTIF